MRPADPDPTSDVASAETALRDQAETEAALRASEQRLAFLLGLSDAMRPLTDPVGIQKVALKLLAEQLDVMRATYFEVDADGDSFALTAHHAHGAPPIPDRMRLSDFAPDIAAAYRAGRTIAFRDTETDRQLGSRPEAYRAIGIRAWAAVPLVKDGVLVAILGVDSRTPRNWTEADLRLLEDLADRTWAAAERARAETALRESDARYRGLFESIDSGYCVIEVLFDDAGKAVDYVFLEANPAFEKQTGLADAIGKHIRALVPGHEEFWFETYGRIAHGGQSERFEHRADALDRWYNVYAFRVDAPERNRVAVLFEDIKDRRLRELHTAVLDAISQDLARLSTPDEIMQAVGGRIGPLLGLSGCLFGDVDETRNQVTVLHGWNADAVPGLIQTFRLDDYLTDAFVRANRAGENFVVADTATDDRTDTANYARIRVGAFAEIPFFTQGRWTAFFAATSIAPRDWRPDEIALLHEIGERLFSRIEQARAEAALRESENRQKLLVAELQHRVRNILAVIRSVFSRTVDAGGDTQDLADHFMGRLDALARTQVIVARDLDGHADLEGLIRDELLSVGSSDRPGLVIEGPDIILPAKTAEMLGLAIHELTTNSIKYGALRSPDAGLAIRWSTNMGCGGASRLDLTWSEQGVPTVAIQPQRQGFGRELIEEALPYRLGAETMLDFRGGGVLCRISLPLGEGAGP